MPISPDQLNTWSHQGAITSSAATYSAVRNALLAEDSPLRGRAIEISLQGSYGNSTNIYADSDVDIVVLYKDTFAKDMSALTPAEQQGHESLYPTATYRWANFRDDVLAALRNRFGAGGVTLGNNAIKVERGSGRLTADVVAAIQFRKYATFVDRNNLTAHWGIQFYNASGVAIVNYPKYHIDRGEAKNQDGRTRGQYKPTIRVFKNFRNYLVAHRLLSEGKAPSYFIECLLYNVPDNSFIGSFTDTIPRIVDHLVNAPYAGFLCQNGVTRLFGSGPTQWSISDCALFLEAARRT